MNVPKLAQNLMTRYERSVVLRSLLQLVPMSIGAVADTALMTLVSNIRADRTREFFDELAKNDGMLRPELLESHEFLHCYFVTMSAALRTQRHEKIQSLARLLKASAVDGKFGSVDEYEEVLKILDDLSHREISVLVLLEQYEIRFPKQEGENDLQQVVRFWEQFTGEVAERFSIEKAEVDSILTRLNRSGCYETFTGGFFDYTGGKGKTTPFFRHLKALALNPDTAEHADVKTRGDAQD